MTRRALTTALGAALAVTAAAPAQAEYFPGQAADAGDIVSLGGVSLDREGAGVVGYVKRDGGVPHVFAVPLVNGNPAPPARRLDAGQPLPSSQARIASARNGRAVATWVNNGSVYAAVRPRGSVNWSAPHLVYQRPLAAPSPTDLHIDQGTSGAAYIAFEAGDDVRVAYLRGDRFEAEPRALDVSQGRAVKDIDLSVAADGASIVAWVEAGAVYTRRFVKGRLSSVTRQASVTNINGVPGGAADSPTIDYEDDSSYAWIIIRQDTAAGSRLYARRLVGSEYERVIPVDQGVPGGDTPDVDVSGRGRALLAAGVRGTNGVFGGAVNRNNNWTNRAPIVNGGPRPPMPLAAISEDGRGTVAWHTTTPSGPTVFASYFNARQFEVGKQIALPQFGPVDAGAGLDVSPDLYGNQAIAWIQGTGGARRVMVAVYDKEPRALANRGSFRDWSRKRSFKLDWGDTEDVWGGIRYAVEVDGQELATTTRTSHTLRGVGDGQHVLNIVTIDSRGQRTIGKDKYLNVDRRGPTGRITSKRSRRGRPADITLTARDGNEILDGSGIDSGTVRWGDGSGGALRVPRIGVIDGARLGHRYRRRGNFRIRIVLRDKAGNRRAIGGRVSVR